MSGVRATECRNKSEAHSEMNSGLSGPLTDGASLPSAMFSDETGRQIRYETMHFQGGYPEGQNGGEQERTELLMRRELENRSAEPYLGSPTSSYKQFTQSLWDWALEQCLLRFCWRKSESKMYNNPLQVDSVNERIAKQVKGGRKVFMK